MNNPFVSVIIPCRNETIYIEGCLNTLTKDQTYPKDKVEILVVDGISNDGTREKVEAYIENHPLYNIRLLENPNKFTPFGLNLGVNNAKGEIIIRADAHTQYPERYIEFCVSYLINGYNFNGHEEKVDNVGGIVIVPSLEDIATIVKEKNNQIKARAIAISVSHFFGAASMFRLGAKEPHFVDTVFGGCYKKDFLDKISYFNEKGEKVYFNEKLKRSQDLELNLRLAKNGGKILLVPHIQFRYYPKITFKEFFIHNFEDGIWATYPLKFTKTFFKIRHYIPLAFLVSMGLFLLLGFLNPFFWWFFAFEVLLHAVMNIYFSTQIALHEKNWKFIFLMPLAFDTRQFGYGFGSIWGLIKILWH